MIKAKYYTIVSKCVSDIQDWFSQNFGFTPTKDEVVSFCIVKTDMRVFTNLDQLIAPLSKIKKITVILTPEAEKQWRDLIQSNINFDASKINDLTGLLSAIIMQRANYLPSNKEETP